VISALGIDSGRITSKPEAIRVISEQGGGTCPEIRRSEIDPLLILGQESQPSAQTKEDPNSSLKRVLFDFGDAALGGIFLELQGVVARDDSVRIATG
jgi:hypothetical protein